jgi:hypothetical protein
MEVSEEVGGDGGMGGRLAWGKVRVAGLERGA